MFLRFYRRFKDGKEHRYWNIAESFAYRYRPVHSRAPGFAPRRGSLPLSPMSPIKGYPTAAHSCSTPLHGSAGMSRIMLHPLRVRLKEAIGVCTWPEAEAVNSLRLDAGRPDDRPPFLGIASWIGLLKADSRAFFTATSKAQAAADHLRGLALRDIHPAMAA